MEIVSNFPSRSLIIFSSNLKNRTEFQDQVPGKLAVVIKTKIIPSNTYVTDFQMREGNKEERKEKGKGRKGKGKEGKRRKE